MGFDMVVASSHVTLPSRRALSVWGWKEWAIFISSTLALPSWAFMGRRNLAAGSAVHFDWSNIVEVCSQYNAYDMCEMPAGSNVKEFEFLSLVKLNVKLAWKT